MTVSSVPEADIKNIEVCESMESKSDDQEICEQVHK